MKSKNIPVVLVDIEDKENGAKSMRWLRRVKMIPRHGIAKYGEICKPNSGEKVGDLYAIYGPFREMIASAYQKNFCV